VAGQVITITRRERADPHLTKQIVSDPAPGSTSEEAMNSDLVALHNLDEPGTTTAANIRVCRSPGHSGSVRVPARKRLTGK
jgi:hypothetical protein